MKKENKNCRLLERQALAEKGAAFADWISHAEKCPECRTRLAMVSKMNNSGQEINKTIGAERFEVIRKAVAERNRPVRNPGYLLFKLATVMGIVLGGMLLFHFFFPAENKIITNKHLPAINREKTDFAWNYSQDTEGLKYKMDKLKRKVYFGDMADENSGNFNLKYRSIKEKASKLRSSERISVY